MEALRYMWIWLTSRLPHRCNNWQMYWEDDNCRGLVCGVCGKVLDEEAYVG